MSDEKQPKAEELFVGYWAKMLARYAGITEAEYDAIEREKSKARRAKQCEG